MRKSEITTSELLISSIAPSVLSCCHHLAGREAEQFLTKLALKLSEKKEMEYSIVIHLLREKPYILAY